MSLIFDKVSVNFKGTEALSEVSLELKEGEVLSVYSNDEPSLSAFAALLEESVDIESGSITLDNEPVNEDSPIGFMNANSQLFGHMNLRNNYLSYLRNKDIEDKEGIIEAVASKLQLAEVLDKKPSEITSDQYLKGIIGKALLLSPKFLVIDNALDRFDGSARTNFWKEIRRIAKDFNVGVLLTTSLASEALFTADKVAYIENGVLVSLDTPVNTYKEPKTSGVAVAFSYPKATEHTLEVADGLIYIGNNYIPVPSFEDKGDAHFGKNAFVKNRVNVVFRTDDLRIDEFGPFSAIVKKVEKYGSKIVLDIDIDNEIFKLYSPIEYKVGDAIHVSSIKEPTLIYDVNTNELI